MRHLRQFLIFTTVFGFSMLHSDETSKSQSKEEKVNPPTENSIDIAKLSESFGHLIAKNIETLGFQLDLDRVIMGLQQSASGGQPPLSEVECVQAITSMQENLFKKQATENLLKAEEFLTQNTKQAGMVSLEEGKLQYKIEKEGSGPIVDTQSTPLIRYTGKFLDGSVFGASKEDESISLDETIHGFSKGLVGMKEGEKRVLYIHPELGYGTNGYLPPNSLLVFEVEVIKASAPASEVKEIITTTTTGNAKAASEIAVPENLETKVIR